MINITKILIIRQRKNPFKNGNNIFITIKKINN